VKRTCAVDEVQAEVDVRSGEFLRYEVSFQGPTAKFLITDEDNRKILDEKGKKIDGVLTAEWPPEAGWVWDGADTHVFLGIMALVESYRLRVTLCRQSGTTKSVIRNCLFKKEEKTDIALELVDVFVTEEDDQ
jgi:hypothetical protein